jgi:prepilin-type N-terminal cleavage/methylation domain-containing protein
VPVEKDNHVRRQCGFTITELLTSIALFSIIAAIGVPMVLGSLDAMQLSAAVRVVQGELQTARLKSVSANRPIRVRFNCPVAAQFRMVELIGTPAAPDARDSAANRCSPVAYPYPVTNMNALARPNHDGPVRLLGTGVSFVASQTVEFWPDGTAHADAGGGNPWPPIAGSGVTITVTYKNTNKSITVNGFGKVQIQ